MFKILQYFSLKNKRPYVCEKDTLTFRFFYNKTVVFLGFDFGSCCKKPLKIFKGIFLPVLG